MAGLLCIRAPHQRECPLPPTCTLKHMRTHTRMRTHVTHTRTLSHLHTHTHTLKRTRTTSLPQPPLLSLSLSLSLSPPGASRCKVGQAYFFIYMLARRPILVPLLRAHSCGRASGAHPAPQAHRGPWPTPTPQSQIRHRRGLRGTHTTPRGVRGVRGLRSLRGASGSAVTTVCAPCANRTSATAAVRAWTPRRTSASDAGRACSLACLFARRAPAGRKHGRDKAFSNDYSNCR